MARKRTEARTFLPESAAAPAPTKRERHPRPKTAVKTVAPAAVDEPAVAAAAAAHVAEEPVSAHDEIARIAYSHWEARGYIDGSPDEDWFRAEREFQSRSR
jgi:hypothetical protein